jgi:hypothetical protein
VQSGVVGLESQAQGGGRVLAHRFRRAIEQAAAAAGLGRQLQPADVPVIERRDDRVSPRTSIASRIIRQMGSSHTACRECGKQERYVASSMGISCFSGPAFAGR